MKNSIIVMVALAAGAVIADIGLHPLDRVMLLKNGDFETGRRDGTPSHWTGRKDLPEGVALVYHSSEGRNNTRCVSVSSTYDLDRPWFWWEQSVLLNEAHSCDLSLWVRSDDIRRDAVAVLSSYSADSKRLDRQHIALPTGSNSWGRLAKTVALPKGAVKGKLQFSMHGPGTLWIDDVELSIPAGITQVPLGGGHVYPVLPLQGEIQLDGNAQEWKNTARATVRHAYQVSNAEAIVMDQETTRGSSDLSFSFALGHTKDGLYMLVEVRDDVRHTVKPYWQGDSLQLAIDTTYGRSQGRYGPDDIAFGIRFRDGEAIPIIDYPAGKNKPNPKDIRSAVSWAPDGYTVEIVVPWHLLKQGQAPAPDRMGFTIVVNDSDGSGRKWAEWTPGIVIGKNPASFGTLLFMDREDAVGLALEPPRGDAKDIAPLRMGATLINASGDPRTGELTFALTVDGTRHTHTRTVNLPPGATELPLVYELGDIPAGEATADITLGSSTAEAHFTILPIRRIVQETGEHLIRLRSHMTTLTTLIAQGEVKKLDMAFPDASLAVAEHFCRWIEADLIRDGDQDLAKYEAEKLTDVVNTAIEEAQGILASPAEHPEIAPPDSLNAQLHGGNWTVDGRPILLIGLNGYDPQWLSDLPRLGGNTYTAGGGTAAYIMRNDSTINPDDIHRTVGASVKKAREYGLSSGLLFGHRMPTWTIEKWPDIDDAEGHFMFYDIDHPEARRMTCRVIEATVKALRNEPGIHAYDLWNEAAYSRMSKRGIANFRAAMRARYETVARLNAAWGTAYASFDTVKPVTRDPEQAPAYTDWIEWNNARFGNYISEMNDAVKRGNSNARTTVKFSNEATIVGTLNHAFREQRTSRHNMGVDRWKMAQLLDIQGCDTRPTLLSPEYAFAWRHPGMAYDLQRSMAPNKPIADSEWHGVQTVYHEDEDQPGDFLNAALWFSYLHGMDMNITWWWSRRGTEPKTQWFRGSLLTQPQLLDAWARNNLLVQRFAPEIVAFQEVAPRVRILFSKSSAILDLHCLDTQKKLYEILHWLSTPIGFVTEEMLLSGFADLDVLFLPATRHCRCGVREATSQLVNSGIKVIGIGPDCLSLTPHGTPHDAETRADQSNQVADLTDTSAILDAVNTRPAAPAVRCIGPDGKTSYPVEFRTVTTEGRTLAYLVGLGKEPADIRIVRGEAPVVCVSLLTGKTFQGKRSIAPYDFDLMVIPEEN